MRTAAEEDLPHIARLDREVFGDAAYPFFVLRQLFDAGFTLVVVDDSEGICAYALALALASEGRGWVLALAVGPRQRGTGLGRELMRETLCHLRSLRVREVLLTVEPANASAIRLYRSLGFTERRGATGHVRDYFGPGEDRLLLSLTL
ncbi:GNAT family N-acetyltransferase [Streptomyces koelreuteriae]|uniref:GNAT family N-acetyltransferase n=1 Tax=Streptomyces koelreuteriae TaxID=2838015 RepID=A0ABX8G5I6_9ACTN|nr:GNAT family N-acetyltransferase [Streptomyces koelreuteriae]